MVDFVSKEKRSKIMSSIRSKNTSIERKVAKTLRKVGIRFRRYPKMSGSPDFLLKEEKTVIFCDGDFWHGYDYKKRSGKLPASWRVKIEANIKRDRKTNILLRSMGWKVIRLWEHDINEFPERVIKRLWAKQR